MKVHNLMEDVVTKLVNKLYAQAKKENAPWLTCDCEHCKIDTICYVLNRFPSKYVVSGRGITHSAETLNDKQILADVETVAIEGMKVVNSTKRPFHKDISKADNTVQEKPAFNFATITGTLLDGSTFEPITGATFTLSCDGKIAEMIDSTFSNPYVNCQQTKGVYCFWMKSLPAEKANETRTFQMKLEITAQGYTPITHHFEITLKSDTSIHSELDSNFTIKLKDMVMFREDIVNEMDF